MIYPMLTSILAGFLRRPQPLSAMAKLTRSVKPHLPPLNFITLHYTYFIGVCLITSVIFWGSSTPSRSVTYTDSLFFTVSAMTLAGLNTVNLSELNTFQQFLLFLLIILGSAILVSSVVVHVRRKAFETRFTNIIEEQRRRRKAQKELAQTTDRSFAFSFTRRRSASGTVAEPEVDGIVKRGRPIPSSTADDLEKGNLDNPGDHSPVDRLHRKHSPNADEEESKDEERGMEPRHTGPLETEPAPQDGTNIDPPRSGPVSPQIRFALAHPPARSKHKRVFSMKGIAAVPSIETHP